MKDKVDRELIWLKKEMKFSFYYINYTNQKCFLFFFLYVHFAMTFEILLLKFKRYKYKYCTIRSKLNNSLNKKKMAENETEV